MNWDQIEGEWKQFRGAIREKWAKLTDDDLDLISGKKERLLGKIQSHYGYKKEAAETELNEFISSIKHDSAKITKN
ncbi:MAG: CsbD family protein [Proteobacteria bacterium]|nr:CsbD family protein [Pseudomonadota bacterium]